MKLRVVARNIDGSWNFVIQRKLWLLPIWYDAKFLWSKHGEPYVFGSLERATFTAWLFDPQSGRHGIKVES